MSKTKSMRGEEVDFDLHKMKSSIGALTITDDVQRRERFVNAKRRRTSRKKAEEMALKANTDEDYKKNLKNAKVEPKEVVKELAEEVTKVDETPAESETQKRKVVK